MSKTLTKQPGKTKMGQADIIIILAVAKALYDHIDNDLAGYWTEGTSNLMQMADALIAKVEGRAQ